MHRVAAEYYRSHGVPERLEEALNSIFLRGPPEDVYGELAGFFAALSAAPVICGVRGRKVLDGSGLAAALEVQVLCTVRNIRKPVSSAVVAASSHFPRFVSYEAVEADEKERVKSVDAAIEWIDLDLSPLITGIPASDQAPIDQLLREYFKSKREDAKETLKVVQDVSPSPTTSTPTSSPKSGQKKRSAKGKKAAVVEKPVPPEEPREPTVCGSPAIGAISLAVAKSSAALSKTPLYFHIATLKNEQPPAEVTMPAPMISLLSYGKSSPGKLNLMKELMVIPGAGRALQEGLDLARVLQNQIVKRQSKAAPMSKTVSPQGCLELGCDRIDQPLELIGETCSHLGLELGTDLHIALNCAAHELMDYNKGKYEVLSGTFKTPDEMVDMYVDLLRRFPSVIALVDPLRREDAAQWQSLADAVAAKCYLISDVSAKSVSWLLEEKNINVPISSGIVIRHTNETSVCDLLDASRLIQGGSRLLVFGCHDEESSEDSLADLAVGLGARFVKLGGLLRGERTTKYNRLLAIEEGLRLAGALGRWPQLVFPSLCSEKVNASHGGARSPRRQGSVGVHPDSAGDSRSSDSVTMPAPPPLEEDKLRDDSMNI